MIDKLCLIKCIIYRLYRLIIMSHYCFILLDCLLAGAMFAPRAMFAPVPRAMLLPRGNVCLIFAFRGILVSLCRMIYLFILRLTRSTIIIGLIGQPFKEVCILLLSPLRISFHN